VKSSGFTSSCAKRVSSESTTNPAARNRPFASTTPLATVTVSGNTNKYYEWEGTNYVKAERAASRTVVTLVLRSQTVTTPQLIFSSDEVAANQPPLQITP
jgi:hypothetical protein